MKILLVALLSLLAACSSSKSKPDRPLCERLHEELEFIHKTMAENNSNYNADPKQAATADAAYRSVSADECHSDVDYVRAIRKYLASYRDPHITATWIQPDATHTSVIKLSTGAPPPPVPVKLEWTATGVFLRRYNDRYFVKAVDAKVFDGAPEVRAGDELLGCGGKKPTQILDEEVLPYASVSAREASLYQYAHSVFFRWDRRAGDTIKCDFKRQGAPVVIVTMKFKDVAEDYPLKTFMPQPKTIYEIEKTPYGHWVKLKSLAGYGTEMIAQLKQFVADAPSLRGDKIIVLDLRENGGGSSTWGTDWIDKLYGYHEEGDKSIKESVWVSDGNTGHYLRFAAGLQQSGGMNSDYVKAVWSDLQNALLNSPKHTFAELHEPPSDPPAHAERGSFKGQVYVLTDWHVFSSGETFLEQMRLMPRVKQVGVATNASTYYSDIRFVATPAGLLFNFPTKKVSGDPLGRKSGEALKPGWPLEYDPAVETTGGDSLRLELERRVKRR